MSNSSSWSSFVCSVSCQGSQCNPTSPNYATLKMQRKRKPRNCPWIHLNIATYREKWLKLKERSMNCQQWGNWACRSFKMGILSAPQFLAPGTITCSVTIWLWNCCNWWSLLRCWTSFSHCAVLWCHSMHPGGLYVFGLLVFTPSFCLYEVLA